MGLDMYLYAKQYVSGWGHGKDGKKELANFHKILKAAGADINDIDNGSPHGHIDFVIGYWRKANQIHSWFVQNVQGGKDECEPHRVSRDKLRELRETCQRALDNPDQAEKILTPRSGFFFGSIEVNEWYFEDLRHTIKVIDTCLSERYEDWEFYYRSSW